MLKYAPFHLRILPVFDGLSGRRLFFQGIDNFNINDLQILRKSVLFLRNLRACLSCIEKINSNCTGRMKKETPSRGQCRLD